MSQCDELLTLDKELGNVCRQTSLRQRGKHRGRTPWSLTDSTLLMDSLQRPLSPGRWRLLAGRQNSMLPRAAPGMLPAAQSERKAASHSQMSRDPLLDERSMFMQRCLPPRLLGDVHHSLFYFHRLTNLCGNCVE